MHTSPQPLETRNDSQSGFLWDAHDAYLFDIDGTLLRSRDRVHFDAFVHAVRLVLGREVSLEGIPLAGNTDAAILREACLRSGVPAPILDAHHAAILTAMCDHVAQRRAELDLMLMPAVEQTLDHLTRRGALLGVATGNLESIGWTKLERAGLRHWFRFGGFSDCFSDRSQLLAHAAQQARALAGPAARLCVVGDTLRDIEAARANSLSVVAVATGRFSFDQLIAHCPDLCAESLAHLLRARPIQAHPLQARPLQKGPAQP
ncbi:MAG TPA: HAD family hydrolase [Terracidiphilus sp.]|nr:HAD family hydrolase [Terracidiphilus sp.]